MKKENEIKKKLRARLESASVMQAGKKNKDHPLSGFQYRKKRQMSAMPYTKENRRPNSNFKTKIMSGCVLQDKDIQMFVRNGLIDDGNSKLK